MSWSIGYDQQWERDIGYGVPAICDHPDCDERIDRGLGLVCCEQQPHGGENGCGLFFCSKHLAHFRAETDDPDDFGAGPMCERCANSATPFAPKPDTLEWQTWKLLHGTWHRWRMENPEQVTELVSAVAKHPGEVVVRAIQSVASNV